MEKIIGGKECEYTFSVGVASKLLWPCFEFIAQTAGINNHDKNIIEEVVLRLADIGISDVDEIVSCTGLERDLIAFIQSRLQQRDCLDSCLRITDTGRHKLGEYVHPQEQSIRVYVDALTGRIIPHYSALDEDTRLRYADEKWERDSREFRYRCYSTAGTECEEWQQAHRLEHNIRFNDAPNSADVTAMLHKMHPGNDSVYARVNDQMGKLCYILIDIVQPEGATRDWVFTDGFGAISSFFSAKYITDDDDKEYITSLRESMHVQTNANDHSGVNAEKKFPKLDEKLKVVQKCRTELRTTANSPDREEAIQSAANDAVLSLVQLAEWSLFYILHNDDHEYIAKEVVADFEKFHDRLGTIIGSVSEKCILTIGFECGTPEKRALAQPYGKLRQAFEKTPALFPLFDVFVKTFENEQWVRKFAKQYPEFLCVLTALNTRRNQSAHGEEMRKTKEFTAFIENVYKQIIRLIKVGLGIDVFEDGAISFVEKIEKDNVRRRAIGQMENALGLSLSRILDIRLIRLLTDMFGCESTLESLDNAIVLYQYMILEHLFVSVNRCIGYGMSANATDWQEKIRQAGFNFDSSDDYGALIKTDPKKIRKALERKSASMNAACIAFCMFADSAMLSKIAKKWPNMLTDVSYVATKRAHGEIPDSVDGQRVLKIKGDIIQIVKFFVDNGFLTTNS